MEVVVVPTLSEEELAKKLKNFGIEKKANLRLFFL